MHFKVKSILKNNYYHNIKRALCLLVPIPNQHFHVNFLF